MNEQVSDVLPTPARLYADERFTGKGITIALVDAGFYPIDDLVKPENRIRAWVDANENPPRVLQFGRDEFPTWSGYNDNAARHWHGLMTSSVAAGNGYLSEGKFRGAASQADLVLVRTTRPEVGIPNENIERALQWIHASAHDYNIRVVSISVSGDPVSPLLGNPIDEAVRALVKLGVVVVVAAGNEDEWRLTPPATAPEALTIGGVDDHNNFNPADVELWHSNYGESNRKLPKPELVAPSIWVAAPILPHSEIAALAQEWFANEDLEKIVEQKLITPFYQHVEGTSFAAPMVAGTAACMLQANPALSPFDVRRILIATATPIENADPARQGAGALDAGAAVTMALAHSGHPTIAGMNSPHIADGRVFFLYRDPLPTRVQVRGDWDHWQNSMDAQQVEYGVWLVELPKPPPGFYSYRFLIDETTWIDDPDNEERRVNPYGEYDSILIVS